MSPYRDHDDFSALNNLALHFDLNLRTLLCPGVKGPGKNNSSRISVFFNRKITVVSSTEQQFGLNSIFEGLLKEL